MCSIQCIILLLMSLIAFRITYPNEMTKQDKEIYKKIFDECIKYILASGIGFVGCYLLLKFKSTTSSKHEEYDRNIMNGLVVVKRKHQ